MRFALCLVMSAIVSCSPHVFTQHDSVELPAILTEPVPPRPELREDVAAEVEEMGARIEEMPATFLEGCHHKSAFVVGDCRRGRIGPLDEGRTG